MERTLDGAVDEFTFLSLVTREALALAVHTVAIVIAVVFAYASFALISFVAVETRTGFIFASPAVPAVERTLVQFTCDSILTIVALARPIVAKPTAIAIVLAQPLVAFIPSLAIHTLAVYFVFEFVLCANPPVTVALHLVALLPFEVIITLAFELGVAVAMAVAVLEALAQTAVFSREVRQALTRPVFAKTVATAHVGTHFVLTVISKPGFRALTNPFFTLSALLFALGVARQRVTPLPRKSFVTMTREVGHASSIPVAVFYTDFLFTLSPIESFVTLAFAISTDPLFRTVVGAVTLVILIEMRFECVFAVLVLWVTQTRDEVRVE